MKACDFWFVSLHCLETPLLAYIGKSRSPSRTFEVSVMSGSLSVGYQRWEISSQVLRHFRFSRSSDVGPMLTWALISLHKLGAKLGLGNHGENLYIKARCLQHHRSRAIIQNVAQHQRSRKNLLHQRQVQSGMNLRLVFGKCTLESMLTWSGSWGSESAGSRQRVGFGHQSWQCWAQLYLEMGSAQQAHCGAWFLHCVFFIQRS